jgi:hypothetical protein
MSSFEDVVRKRDTVGRREGEEDGGSRKSGREKIARSTEGLFEINDLSRKHSRRSADVKGAVERETGRACLPLHQLGRGSTLRAPDSMPVLPKQ